MSTKRKTKSRKPRKRDYKAEYKRRIKRALDKGYSRSVARGHAKKTELGIVAAEFLNVKPGTLFLDVIQADALHVFGRIPRRMKGDHDAPEYQLRLEELARRDGNFNWLSEVEFVAQMQALGMTERDAYSTWYGSPPK